MVRPNPKFRTGETLSQWAAPEKRDWVVTRAELIGVLDAYAKFQKQRTLWGRIKLYLDHGLFRFGQKQLAEPVAEVKKKVVV